MQVANNIQFSPVRLAEMEENDNTLIGKLKFVSNFLTIKYYIALKNNTVFLIGKGNLDNY